MSPVPDNFYSCWRSQSAGFDYIREGTAVPPEKLLQAIWHHQRLLREGLKTADGKSIRVLHPGFWNREAGPDFRGAVIKIGGETKTGDIEIDLVQAGWHAHAHDRNPAFRNVVLHVVWDVAVPTAAMPVMTLKSCLDAPLGELAHWLGTDAAEGWPTELKGQCCAPLCELPPQKVNELLRQAACVRFQRKAHELESRARQVGWQQTLWEGLFRALGYKQNVWPMQRVAELISSLHTERRSVFELQALLLGVSGLLPNDMPRSGDSYLRKIWDIWWRERDAFSDVILPRSVWKFNGLRPLNHPQRRLALAAYWLSDKKFLPALEQWFAAPKTKTELLPSLFKIMQVTTDEYWTHHFTLRSAKLKTAQPLIGEKRLTDLAINVILPWLWMRAASGKNVAMQERAEEFYSWWPAAEDNSVLRLARRRLLGQNKVTFLQTAAAQQGLLQIVRDFCEHSNAVCLDCQFPQLVRQLNQQQA